MGRVWGFALIDIFGTLVGAWYFGIPWWMALGIGVGVHRLFRVRTPLNTLIFGD